MTKNSEQIAFTSVVELAEELASGALTATQLVEVFLERIRAHEELHAFIDVYADEARAAAAAADKAIAGGKRASLFHGIPVAIKDLIEIEGHVTTGGSRHFADRVSATTATLVERLRAAGVIVLGKTHTVEFAYGGWGTNQRLGTPRNPWDPHTHRAPGGSSSGSGVAVAAGLAPWAIGTDTGGSVRLPASWCGLTGLKTTIGRVSVHGVMPLSTTLDTPGPMCRSVEDAAAMLELLQGADEHDPRTSWRPACKPFEEMRAGVAGLRLASLPDADLAGVDEEVAGNYRRAAAKLVELGAEMGEVGFPRPMDEMAQMLGRIVSAEGYFFYGEAIDDPNEPLDEDVRARMRPGRDMSAQTYLRALADREAMKREMRSALAGIDAWLLPTTATPAPAVAEIDQSATPAGFTRPVNLLDYCALALPNGFTAGGLPTSFQVVCDGYQEAMALRIGWAYQQATDWHRRTPFDAMPR